VCSFAVINKLPQGPAPDRQVDEKMVPSRLHLAPLLDIRGGYGWESNSAEFNLEVRLLAGFCQALVKVVGVYLYDNLRSSR